MLKDFLGTGSGSSNFKVTIVAFISSITLSYLNDSSFYDHGSIMSKVKPLINFFKNEKQNDPYRMLFESNGFSCKFTQVLEFDFINVEETTQLLLNQSQEYWGIIFTSKNAVSAILQILSSIDYDKLAQFQQCWNSKHIFSIGSGLEIGDKMACQNIHDSAINAFDLGSIISNCIESTEQLSKSIQEGKKLLYMCGNIRRKELPDFLNLRQIPFKEMVVYRTKQLEVKDVSVNQGIGATVWVFFSPSGVSAALDSISDFQAFLANYNIYTAAIGDTTASSLKLNGISPIAVAKKPNPESLHESILSVLSPN